jgi:hypothetical protein
MMKISDESSFMTDCNSHKQKVAVYAFLYSESGMDNYVAGLCEK